MLIDKGGARRGPSWFSRPQSRWDCSVYGI